MLQVKDLAVRLAESNGHTVERDRRSAVDRWTCTRCARSVMRHLGKLVGSATTERCTGRSGDG